LKIVSENGFSGKTYFYAIASRTRSDTLKELEAHIEACEVKNTGSA